MASRGYGIEVAEEVAGFLDRLDEKGRRICTDHLKKLAAGPYPGRGPGNKERLVVRGEDVYRIHISRRFTAFYVIVERERLVRILELLPIDQAHKKYGYK